MIVQLEHGGYTRHRHVYISHLLTAILSAMPTSISTVNGRYNICQHIGSGSFGMMSLF
jgi:hypothetical protein